MTDRVDPRGGRDAGGHAERQCGIEDRDSTRRLFVTASHLHMRLRVGDQRERLSFASRAGCRGDRDRRQHRLRRLADPPVVLDLSAVGQQEVDPLRAVHAATTADRDEEVDPLGLRNGQSSIYVVGGRIGVDVLEDERIETRLAQGRDRLCHVSGPFNAVVGDNEDSRAAQFARQLAQTRHRSRSEDDSRARIEVERSECVDVEGIGATVFMARGGHRGKTFNGRDAKAGN